MSLPWDMQRVTECTEAQEVAEKFIQANCYLPPERYWICGMLILSWKGAL